MEVDKISRLPDEVLELLFQMCDGQSLTRCKRVCWRWSRLIQTIEKTGCIAIWRCRCHTEIPDDILVELTGNKLSSEIQATGVEESLATTECTGLNAFYRSVYRKWFAAKTIASDDWLKCGQTTPNDPVGCMRVSGSCVVTGHASGAVQIFDTEVKRFVRRVTMHRKAVTDLELVYMTAAAMKTRSQGSLDLAHHHVISAGKDSRLRIGSLFDDDISVNDSVAQQFHSQASCVRIFGSVVAVLFTAGCMCIWEMVLDNTKRRLLLNETRVVQGGHNFETLWFGFFNYHVTCISEVLDKLNYNVVESRWANLSGPSIDLKNDYLNSDVVVTHCYLFRQSIVILLTADRRLFISVDNAFTLHHFPTMEYFRGYLTSVVVRGNLLAIGTNVGSVYLYYFGCSSDLINVKLDLPIWKNSFGNSPITSIDIALDERQVLLAAASKEKISSVIFFPKTTSNFSLDDVAGSFELMLAL